MDFSTLSFWLIMLPVMAVMFIGNRYIKKDKWKCCLSKYGLCLLSLSLLCVASLETFLVFVTVTMLAYIGCRCASRLTQQRKKLLLGILIVLLLSPLLYYKYANFVTREVMGLPWDTFRELIIPIGISFYTFQTIAFCIDTLKRNHEMPHFIDYMNFCSFFPQIVAGPIERKDSLLPQMESLRWRWDAGIVAQGVPYIILGLFFKMALADNLATIMQIGYGGDNAFFVWINNIAFGFRIYFDFAGYGLIAYGIAKALGINITLNFVSPYTSCNVTDFWRRWHISLTLWFRDYIYFALGGSRTRFWWFNIIFMFLVSGIWHGAGWNFIIWGTLAGITMVVHRCFKRFNYPLPGFIGWLMTICVMMFIWMFFYETDMNIVWKNVCTVFDPSSYDVIEFIRTSTLGPQVVLYVALSALVVFLEFISDKKYGNPYYIFQSHYVCGILIYIMCMLYVEEESQFIYFAF